jgi:hypothetical protein
VNVDPVLGGMGVARPRQIATRTRESDDTYSDRRWDNSGTEDFRGKAKKAKKAGFKKGPQAYQDQMARDEAALDPFPDTPFFEEGDDYMPDNRRDMEGYQSPPPTPFIAQDLSLGSMTEEVTINEAATFGMTRSGAHKGALFFHEDKAYEVIVVKARNSKGEVTVEAHRIDY